MVTFLIVPPAIFALSLYNGYSVAVAQLMVAFVLAVFGCVLLHEFGHALAAKFLRIRTRDIILTPIGGLARLERFPDRPLQEIVVALAGPMVNVIIAGGFFVTLAASGMSLAFTGRLVGAQFFTTLMWANLLLMTFNLIPAFPMDGGRVLRAVLATQLPRDLATTVAARLGQLISVGFIIFGLASGVWSLSLVGIFVFLLAGHELEQSRFLTHRRKVLQELSRWVVDGEKIPEIDSLPSSGPIGVPPTNRYPSTSTSHAAAP